ncbi:hypothetical protein DUI87_08909 [Hirundo rustica rustica]|uniref:Uncharacterized protein n=1 Tax=Hirundo rustica rustica TaxID=333673 RepID=A0A3M0KL81_HIRRU|nr:hypothetical protein DUI87_08909 [Hirundo rustica rustica]
MYSLKDEINDSYTFEKNCVFKNKPANKRIPPSEYEICARMDLVIRWQQPYSLTSVCIEKDVLVMLETLFQELIAVAQLPQNTRVALMFPGVWSVVQTIRLDSLERKTVKCLWFQFL